jgi:dihydrofolate reductase
MTTHPHRFTVKVVVDLAMSLDGFIAGAPDQPERLHDWMFPAAGNIQSGAVDVSNAAVIEASVRRYGAIIMGRHAYDLADQYDGFVDNPYAVPHFVVTHEAPAQRAKGETELTFVTTGIVHALELAKVAAGSRDIAIGGGAEIAQQYLNAGLVDEIAVALVLVLFGSGVRLFADFAANKIELEPISVINAPGVTHLRYTVIKED